MITGFDKAIAALIGSVLTILGAFNIHVDFLTPELIGTIGSVLTAILTYVVPNKKA